MAFETIDQVEEFRRLLEVARLDEDGLNHIADRLQALTQLSEMLEACEDAYQAVTGDPQWTPCQRPAYAIGQLLDALRDDDEHDELLPDIMDEFLVPEAPLEFQVVGLRFALACLASLGFQCELLEERLVAWCRELAAAHPQQAPTRHDTPPQDSHALLLEARATYATGLLAIALTSDTHSDEAVQTDLVSALATYLRTCVLGGADNPQEGQNSPVEQQAVGKVRASGVLAFEYGGVFWSGGKLVVVQAGECNVGEDVSQGAASSSNGVEVERAHVATWRDEAARLRQLRERYCAAALACLGEYLDSLAPVLQQQGPEVLLEMLRRHGGGGCHLGLTTTLRLLCSLVAHRRFVELFIDLGALDLLVELPHNQHTRGGLSTILFRLSSVGPACERAFELLGAAPEALLSAALRLLGSGCDPARKNAALFLGNALHQRGALAIFERCGGLRQLLALLRACALLLRGGSAAELRVEKQVGYHASSALRHYFRTSLVLHLADLQARGAAAAAAVAPPLSRQASLRAVDASPEVVEAAVWQLEQDPAAGEAFVRAEWPAVDEFLSCGGPALMLDLIEASPGERYFNEMATHALDVLQLVTLRPHARPRVIAAVAHTQRPGMAVLLAAANGQAFADDPEVMHPALLVLANCLWPPPSLARLLPLALPEGERTLAEQLFTRPVEQRLGHVTEAPGGFDAAVATRRGLGRMLEQQYAAARAALRHHSGIRCLLGLLHSRGSMPAGQVDRTRALATRCLLGLALGPATRHILSQLQVGRLLAELVNEPAVGSALRRVGPGMGAAGGGDAALPPASWNAQFKRMALEIIGLTTAAGAVGRASTAAAASDAAAPALHKIERTAIAAASHIAYPPAELLVLIHDHLRASGLPGAAAALAQEAGLPGLQPTGQHQMGRLVECPGVGGAGAARTPGNMQRDALTPGMAIARRRSLHLGPSLQQTIARSAPPGGPAAPSSLQEASTPSLTPLQSQLFLQPPPPVALLGEAPLGTPASAKGRKRRALHPLPPQPHPHPRLSSGAGLASTPAEPSGRPSQHSAAGSAPEADAAHPMDLTPHYPIASVPTTSASGAARHFPSSLPAWKPFPPPRTPYLWQQPERPSQHGVGALLANLPRRIGPLPAPPHPAAPPATPPPPRAAIASTSHSPPPIPATRRGLPAPGTTPGPQPIRSAADALANAVPAASKLNAIVMQYLRHQHRQACLQAPHPVSTLPPISLLKPHTIPTAKRSLEAPLNATSRLLRRQELGQDGGRGGRRQQRHLLFSRFRPVRLIREEERSAFHSAAFLGAGAGALLAAGCGGGQLRVLDPLSGAELECTEAHRGNVHLLGAVDLSVGSLLCSSSKDIVNLWRAHPPGSAGLSSSGGGGILQQAFSLADSRAGHLNPAGSKLVCLDSAAGGSGGPTQEARLYDVATSGHILTLVDSLRATECMREVVRCRDGGLRWSPSGELLLWGSQLFDPRAPALVHRFDQFTEAAAPCFHPAGLEAILNSEVWDLRTFRLRRSVPCLHGSQLAFSPAGDVAYAWMRGARFDNYHISLGYPWSPMMTAFRSVDVTDYSEITVTELEGRCPVDLAVEASDNFIAVVGSDMAQMTSVRVYEVGRQRLAEDEDDDDENGGGEDDSSGGESDEDGTDNEASAREGMPSESEDDVNTDGDESDGELASDDMPPEDLHDLSDLASGGELPSDEEEYEMEDHEGESDFEFEGEDAELMSSGSDDSDDMSGSSEEDASSEESSADTGSSEEVSESELEGEGENRRLTWRQWRRQRERQRIERARERSPS